MKPVRGLIYFCAFYCTFIFADWKTSLELLEQAKNAAGLEEINEIQNYIWSLKDSVQKMMLTEALETYIKEAPVLAEFKNIYTHKGAGPAKKKFLKLEGGLEIIFKHQDSIQFSATTMERELLAYELNKLWKLEIVPVTVERAVDNVVGSAQLWVPYFLRASDYLDDLSNVPKYFWMRVFDYLINEPDRHKGNFLVGDQVVAIDNGYSLDLWGRNQAASVFIPNEIKGDQLLSNLLEMSGDQAVFNLLNKKISSKVISELRSRRFEVLRFINSIESRAQIHAYPKQEWKYSQKPRRLSFDLKKFKGQSSIVLGDHAGKKHVLMGLRDKGRISFKINEAQYGKLRGIKFTYASRDGVKFVLRTSENEKLILAQHFLPSTGANDHWKNIIVPTAELLNFDQELDLEFLNPSRNGKNETVFISVIELEFETEVQENPVILSEALSSDLEVGYVFKVGEKTFKVLERLGRGGFGVVYKIIGPDSEIFALKVARSEAAINVIKMEEWQRFKLLEEIPSLKVSKYYYLGKNFVIKDYHKGVSAKSFLEQFNIEKTQDVVAIVKLIEVFRYLAKNGIFAPAHNLNNWFWDGQDWVIIDSSDRMEMGLFEFQALLKYRKNFEEIWTLKNPALKGFSPLWIKILNSPVYNINIGECGSELL